MSRSDSVLRAKARKLKGLGRSASMRRSYDINPLLARNMIAAGIAAQEGRGLAVVETREEVERLRKQYNDLIEHYGTLYENTQLLLLKEQEESSRLRVRLKEQEAQFADERFLADQECTYLTDS